MAALTTIEGIGPQIAKKLKTNGVGSVEKLLEAGQTRKGRKALAENTGIDASKLLRFVNHADLMRIRGVGGEYAELLEAGGVDTVAELAQRNADRLHEKLATVNDEKSLVRVVPAKSRVGEWVKQAKTMSRAVHH